MFVSTLPTQTPLRCRSERTVSEVQTFGVGLGLVVGLRHALDADHLIALGTLVAERRPMAQAIRMALLWGLGHSLTFLAVGLPVLLAGLRLSDDFQLVTELLVALMLVALGLLSLRPALSPGREPIDREPREPARRSSRAGLRPLVIGLVHGLAGSSAAALLVLTTSDDATAGVGYLLAFAAGMVLAMVAVLAALAWILNAVGRRPFTTRGLIWLAALANLALGAMLLYHALNPQDST